MPRILLIAVAALLALIVGAVLLVPVFLDKDKVVALAADAIKEQTGATLEVAGDLDLTVFPRLGIAFTRASITMPERAQADVEVGSARVGVALLPLLTGSVQIDTIAVEDLTLRMQAAAEEPRAATEGMTDEQLANWYAEREKQREAAGSAAGAEAVLAVPLALNVAALDLRNARLETFDPASGQTSVIELRSLAARDLNLAGRPIPLSLELRVPGEQPVTVTANGRFVIQQNSDTVTLENLSVAVAGATAEPLTLTLNGAADLARQSAETAITLALGPTRGEGTLRYASFESPQIDADLALNLLDPALLALAGPEAAAEAGAAEPANGDAPLPLDALRSIDTRAALRIEQARLGAHTIEDLGMQLRAKEGVIELTEVRGRLHEGQLTASATFNGRMNTATLNTRGGLTGLSLTTALQAMESRDLLSGSANLEWQLNSRGSTLNSLIAALEGPVTLTTDAVVLKGASVEKLICQAVALTNQESLTATFAPDTRFRALAATINVADGRASLNPLTAELPGIALTGSGHLDLLQQNFDTSFKARLSNELEQVDNACRVSKRLLSLDFPVNCRGDLSGEPAQWCRVDTEDILRNLAIGEGKRKLEKEAGKLFEKFLGGDKKRN